MKVLIVEDDPVAANLMAALLEKYGECSVAGTGTEAVTAFENAWEEGVPFHVMFLDLMLPEMDGHEVLRKIRELENEYNLESEEKLKVIITSALTDEENFLKAHITGSEWYLTKPIGRAELDSVLAELGYSPKERKQS